MAGRGNERGTLLFVHGTGVREAGYTATLGLIQRQVQQWGLGFRVSGCFWGGPEGAWLRAGGASIPGYEVTGGGVASSAEDETLALWSVLYTDPWYELRLLRHRPSPRGDIGYGTSPAMALRALVEGLAVSPEPSVFAVAGLGGRFADSAQKLLNTREFADAIKTASDDALEHRGAISRALVAAVLVSAQDAGEPAVDGVLRDELVRQVTSALQGYGLGIGEFLLRPVKGLASRLITRKLTGDRGSLSDEAAPMAGDVLRYLAHGAGAREFVRAAMADAGTGPTYLLAHSLGGIVCADLLVRDRVPGVKGLITVGSQAPFLYEIGAFPGLQHPDPLPAHMPPWLNVYDRRDILSYVGAPIFGNGVRDVCVDNGQPFAQSHSAYWSNRSLWDAIEEFVG